MIKHSLQGIRVLDLSRILAGPWCTQNLADLGAAVTKVEHPQRGDDTRGWGPPYLSSPDSVQTLSAYFICCNRGKQSLALDFSTDEGADLLRTLIMDTDVLVENFRPGVLGRYGLDYERLKSINPRLIYLSITGYGQSGPLSDKPGYDYVFQGAGGLMSYTGNADGEDGAGPLRTGVAVVDLTTGMYATSAILAALFQREKTGEGTYIDISLLDVAIALNANQGANYLVSGKIPPRSGNAHPNCAPYEVFRCSDGHLILAIGNDSQFQKFCGVAKAPDLAADSRFTTNALRIKNLPVLRSILASLFAERTRLDWTTSFDAAGVPWGPINNMEEAFASPQVAYRQMAGSAKHAVMGEVPMVRNPMLSSEAERNSPLAPPPLLGEHTQQILGTIRKSGLDTENSHINRN